jgi:N-acyl-D-amino-acid deacylase
METYAPQGRRKEFAEKVKRAREWLLTATPTATEESAFQLLGLGWANASPHEVKEPTRRLLAQQRSDGGWAQLPKLESDAYATGQVLMALHLGGGLAATQPAYQRGLEYLLKTQYDDGSWLVESRARPFQPYFESGISHGPNQWISAAATSFASMALMLTAEPVDPRDR